MQKRLGKSVVAHSGYYIKYPFLIIIGWPAGSHLLSIAAEYAILFRPKVYVRCSIQRFPLPSIEKRETGKKTIQCLISNDNFLPATTIKKEQNISTPHLASLPH